MKNSGKLPVIISAFVVIVLLCGCRKSWQESAIAVFGGGTLEYEDIGFFNVREIGDDVAALEISGVCMHSALAVKSMHVKRKRDLLAVYFKTSLCTKEGDSGAFRYEISIPADVNKVVLGTRKKEIWSRAVGLRRRG